ncbi:hypothetical protein [Flavobacterium sp.]|jgi:hypothetical protein|uniref:hypothetical protein n=1 Tax=Flavobacterium sp. TaxID=239 RepID=UPI0037C037D4
MTTPFETKEQVTEYDPEQCWTAKQLRSMGYTISDKIPNCAWVRSDCVVLDVKSSQTEPEKGYSFGLTVELEFSQPFQWVEVSLTAEKKNHES